MNTRSGPAMAALFAAAFVMGSAELLVVGVIDLIAADLAVPVSTAGAAVTAYALGIAIGGPVLTALTIRSERRRVLAWALAAYVIATAAPLVTSSATLFLTARFAAGSLHGLFIGVAFAVAGALVPPERTGRAIGIVLGGISVSTALGVPLGTLVGQAMGWRAGFVGVSVLGLGALLALLRVVPAVAATGGGRAAVQARHAFAPRVLAVLGTGLLILGGQYAVLTYITPFLQERTGVSSGAVSAFLLAFGVATAVGVFAGGWAADRSATRTLVLGNAALVVALGLLHVVAAIPVLVAVVLVVWGVVGMGLVPSLQYRVLELAGPGRDLAATLPASALNAGIALGALAGGWTLDAYGAGAPVITGLVVAAVALPAAWATSVLRPTPTQQIEGVSA
ncbi:DHA1 family inner membrane transport protein [Pseudonocardia hierapolitana]|uniref:DHA1 family inner membrane transport protein n=1 Tax=Pseudonocardia hierapolitana TaxID=1128676 RepID=A0A561SZ14_9PSEU|nr:MFS transporter [Pseudonocardia hierapolitana]TWF80093.1 DHA1 family inner membrane transport protein [Pseudonocardia hierapolitana]